MRSLIPFCSLGLVACGIFGATDSSHVDEAASSPDASSGEADAALPPVGSAAPPGIYVSASRGRDDGDGSSTAPLKTLTRALAVGKDFGLPVIAFGGSVEDAAAEQLAAAGLCAAFPIVSGPMSLEDAIRDGSALLTHAVARVVRLL